MRRKKCIFSLVVFSSLSSSLVAQEGPAISAKNFLRINQEFCTAGQPALEDLTKLHVEGVKSILNLRRPEEDPITAEEQKQAQRLGMKYFNIPVDSSNPQEEEVDEFLKIVTDQSNRPMLIHCASANRVGGFWMIYRVLKDKWTLEKAEEEARRIGLRTPVMSAFARRYIEQHAKGGEK